MSDRPQFTIGGAIRLVEKAVRRHGMSNEEEPEFYHQAAVFEPQDYSKPRNDAQITQDLNVAHENIRKLVRERVKMLEMLDTERTYRRIILWLLTMTWSALGSIAVALWETRVTLLHYLLKVH